MRIENIPNPGTYSGSQQLRVKVAHAISAAENAAARAPDGKAALAGNLYSMFAFAAAAVQNLRRSPPDTIQLAGGVIVDTVAVGARKNLVAQLVAVDDTVETPANFRILWESQREDIVKVDPMGVIEGVKAGVGKITAKIRANDGPVVSVEFTITVTA